MSDSHEAEKQTKLNSLSSRIRIKTKKEVQMKTRYRLAVWSVMVVIGSTILGGGFWIWLTGIAVGKCVARLALTAVVVIVVYLLVYALIFGGMFWLITI